MPSPRVPAFLLPGPKTRHEPSLLESARNYRCANPLPCWWFRRRHDSPIPPAAMAERVLLPLPRLFRVHLDRANPVLAPTRDAPPAENRALHPSHLRAFPVGFPKLPVSNRSQSALAPGAAALLLQNSADPKQQ